MAQDPPAQDVITFINGEKMTGQLRGATNSGVTFRGEMVGDVVVDWGKIQDLHSARGFAALMRGQEPRSTAEAAPVPNNAPTPPAPPSPPPPSAPRVVAVAPPPAPERTSPPVTTARAEPAPVVPEVAQPVPAANQQTPAPTWFGHRLFTGWKGDASFGLAITQATQNDTSISASVDLLRTSPGGDAWPLRTRTFFNFYVVYNKITQEGDFAYFDPGTRMLFLPGSFSKNYAIHADLVRDYFLFPRVFVFGGTTFDHNYAQGLELLQSYGGGVGVVAYHTAHSELDLRGGVGYTGQRYLGYPALDKKLVGSRFEESYEHEFANGMSFSERAGFRPAWNDSRAIFAGGTASFNIPVYHRLGLNISSFDFWNNDPPPQFLRNIFQVTAGVNYSFTAPRRRTPY